MAQKTFKEKIKLYRERTRFSPLWISLLFERGLKLSLGDIELIKIKLLRELDEAHLDKCRVYLALETPALAFRESFQKFFRKLDEMDKIDFSNSAIQKEMRSLADYSLILLKYKMKRPDLSQSSVLTEEEKQLFSHYLDVIDELAKTLKKHKGVKDYWEPILEPGGF